MIKCYLIKDPYLEYMKNSQNSAEACKKMFIGVAKIKDCICEGTFINCWWEYKMAEPIGKTVQGFRKLNIHPPL